MARKEAARSPKVLGSGAVVTSSRVKRPGELATLT
jgi:hypothetical protein